MDYDVTDCYYWPLQDNAKWYTCPLLNVDEGTCQHPSFPKGEEANSSVCPLRKEPLTLVASFK